jgi:hypothetical protein
MRTARPLAAELDQALDRVSLPLEDGLDGAVRSIADPTGDAPGLRPPPQRLAEEDALYVTLHDHSPAVHERRLDPR